MDGVLGQGASCRSPFVPPEPLTVAVLLLGFSRPESTERVFETIRKAKVPRLYVAVDGPRPGRPEEAVRCQRVRDVIKGVDWPCEVNTLFRQQNLGCKKAVEQAVTWFFDREERGIVLEDDCLPEQSFFWFCQDLLRHYENDPRIGVISGGNYQNGVRRSSGSYYFSKYSGSWGWATWRRYWSIYDVELKSVHLPELLERLTRISEGSRIFVKYWGEIFLRCKPTESSDWASVLPGNLSVKGNSREPSPRVWYNTWDYPLLISGFNQRSPYLHIVPDVNLVRNIGFTDEGTHTAAGGYNPTTRSENLSFPLRHPVSVIRCQEADAYVDRTFFCIRPLAVLRLVAARRYSYLRSLWLRLKGGR